MVSPAVAAEVTAIAQSTDTYVRVAVDPSEPEGERIGAMPAENTSTGATAVIVEGNVERPVPPVVDQSNASPTTSPASTEIHGTATAAPVVASSPASSSTSPEIAVRDASTGKIYCRSRRFLVPYEAADAGPSGISAVRLYYTTDGGRSWTLYAERPEAKGSFEFVAPADGTYGFTVQALDKAGNVERKDGPTANTKPEIQVAVDTKAPQTEPIFPRQDMQVVPGVHLRVRFRAGDDNLSPSTAVVCIQKDAETNWTSLPNVTYENNEFFVQGDILFPGTYRVKLAVGDRAGNVAEDSYSFTCTPNAQPPVKPQGPLGMDWEVPIASPPRAKSLEFDIDYSVQDIGGQPPAKVALWYTTDNGATWQAYGLDPDVTSPFRFQAPKEGVYGFKIVAESKAGVSEPRPRPGTKPDISTLVDITYPTLMLDDPRGGESYQGGVVHFVKWTAKDENFGSLPISLYTSRDGGPWQLLAADLPNTGTYGWNVPLIDYATYRLKIEARDLVGNVTSVTSDNLSVVSAAPETTIRAVTPAVPTLGVKTITPEAEEGAKPSAPAPDTESSGSVPEAKTPEPTAPPMGENSEDMKKLADKAAGLRLRGDYDGAKATLREMIKRDKGNVDARCELGAILLEEGRLQESVDTLEDARSIAPQDIDVLYNLAGAYYALGDYKDAAAAFETLVGLDPQNEAAYWNLAKTYYNAGEPANARKAWQSIVDLNKPGSAFVKKARVMLEKVPEPAAKPKK